MGTLRSVFKETSGNMSETSSFECARHKRSFDDIAAFKLVA